MDNAKQELIDQERRRFIRHGAQVGFAATAMPMALNLMAIGEAAAQTQSEDYKALVCISLDGGNDYANTLITYDEPNYNLYYNARPQIAIPRDQLGATVLNKVLPNNRRYALHPSMPGIASLLNSGKAAVLLNVGPLIRPYDPMNYTEPGRLFSHADQVNFWQSMGVDGEKSSGWGGRLADSYFKKMNVNPGNTSDFTCVAIDSHGIFLVGDQVKRPFPQPSDAIYTVNPLTVDSEFYRPEVMAAFTKIWELNLNDSARQHLFEKEYNRTMKRAHISSKTLGDAITNSTLSTPFPDDLGHKLKRVAQIIAARQTLGVKRQVFMVVHGGFDLHSDFSNPFAVLNHEKLLGKLDSAVKAFYDATVELGIASNVVTFTISEFGRTLTSNGDGTDHGWGNHHFIIGDAVNKKTYYGKVPSVDLADDTWHIGQGRMIPTTSVDQYAATLGKWFGGLTDIQLQAILPNLKNFGTGNYPQFL